MTKLTTDCPDCGSYIASYDSIREEYLPANSCGVCGWKSGDSKQWGGPGRNQGRKGAWQSGETRTIRVPVALADEVMVYARALDSGEVPGRSPNPFAQLGDVLASLPTAPTAPAATAAPTVPAATAAPTAPAATAAPTAPAATAAPAAAKLSEAIALLNEALGLKANAGGAIKTKIRQALELLNE